MEALLTANSSDYSQAMIESSIDAAADEAAWIRQAQRSDAKAFESLYRLHVDKIYGLCLRMTGNVSEAEDCTQDAFIQAWNKLAKFRGDSAFATWLHRVAVNTVLGRIRKSKREQDRIQAVSDTSAATFVADDAGDCATCQTRSTGCRPVRGTCLFCMPCMATAMTRQAACSA